MFTWAARPWPHIATATRWSVASSWNLNSMSIWLTRHCFQEFLYAALQQNHCPSWATHALWVCYGHTQLSNSVSPPPQERDRIWWIGYIILDWLQCIMWCNIVLCHMISVAALMTVTELLLCLITGQDWWTGLMDWITKLTFETTLFILHESSQSICLTGSHVWGSLTVSFYGC